MQQEIFRQIVTLDESRILIRLRSSHAPRSKKARGRAKPKLMASLNGAVLDKSIQGRDENAKALISNVRLSSKELTQRFSEFENLRRDPYQINVWRDMLMDFLKRVEKFDVDGLKNVLAMSRLMNPSLRDHLPRAMSKIGRYFRTACDLVDAARSDQYSLFARISVRSIETPHLNLAFLANQTPSFDKVAQRVTGPSYRRVLKAYGPASVSKAQKQFESRMSYCPIPWKVHAEIQLLLFYDQQSQASRPRIIGSSKSACYLCDLFIQLHGEYCIPRTHGRLYDRWMLPDQSFRKRAPNKHLTSVIDRFNAALEAKVIQTLRSGPRPFSHPNESVLFPRQPWSPTLTLSESHEQGSVQGKSASSHRTLFRDRKTSPSMISPSLDPLPVVFNSSRRSFELDPHQKPEPVDLTERDLSRRQRETKSNTPADSPQPSTAPPNATDPSPPIHTPESQSQTNPNIESPSPDPPPPKPKSIILYLPPGDSASHKLNSPQDILTIETGPMTIHASGPSNLSPDSPSPNTCWIHIQRLTSESDTAHDGSSSYESIDIASLATDHDTVVENGAVLSSKGLALRCGRHVVVIKYGFEDSESMEGKRW